VSGIRDMLRRLVTVEDRQTALEADLGNLPVRWTDPTGFRLEVDHEEHEASTPVHELGIQEPGKLHDQWKVLNSPGASRAVTATERPPNKLALNVRRGGQGHEGGWVWADHIDNNKARRHLEPGWGRLDDVIGAERKGLGPINIRTSVRFNNGDGSVGPIWFAEEPDDFEYAEGPVWVLGRMLFQDGYWWPGFEMPWEYSAKMTDVQYPIDCVEGPDNCRMLTAAHQYQKGGTPGFKKVWALRLPNSTRVNVAEHVACNRRDIDFLFRLVDYVDCGLGESIGLHDNFLDQGFNIGGTWDTWARDVTNWIYAAYAWIACAQAAVIAPACTWQFAVLQGFRDAAGTSDAARDTWAPICPQDPQYSNEAYETCPQVQS